jgi:hypothetical protein
LIALIVLGAIAFLFAVVRYSQIIWRRMSRSRFSFLAIRPVIIETKDSGIKVSLKVAYAEEKKLIIQELAVKTRLVYISAEEGVLAWIKLAQGYFIDDVAGLQTVFGEVFPSSTWIIGGPVHQIKNQYVRKPLSVLLGLITVYFFIFCLIPLFWPLLWSGPYREFQQIVPDDNVTLHRGKSKLTRPFIIEAGTEGQMDLEYSNLPEAATLRNGSPLPGAKISYVNEIPATKIYKLPRADEFVWKSEVSLYVKVNELWGVYPVESATAMARLEL